MVSSGFTNMNSLVYNNVGVPSWLSALNTGIKPSDNPNQVVNISMGTKELQERVIMAQNAIPLNQARVVPTRPFGGNGQSAFGGTGSPFGGR